MSSCPGPYMDADFVRDIYVQPLGDREVKRVLEFWAPFREEVEAKLEEYLAEEEAPSWRSFRNAAFDWLPDPLANEACAQSMKWMAEDRARLEAENATLRASLEASELLRATSQIAALQAQLDEIRQAAQDRRFD